MLVVRLPNVFSGFGLDVPSDTVLSALYTLTRPVVDLKSDRSHRLQMGERKDRPYGEVPASLIASHDAASKTALVLPALDTPALTDVPDVHLRIFRETEQLALALSRSGPPQRADGSVGLESGDNLGCAGSPIDEVDVSTTASDGEDVPGGIEGADVHAPILVGAERGSPQATR